MLITTTIILEGYFHLLVIGSIMKPTGNRRDGVRVVVSEEIEGIIFSDDGFPDFCNKFVINMGGIKISHLIEHHEDNKLNVCLFHEDGSNLSIDSQFIKSTDDTTIIRFSHLSYEQRFTLNKMLTLQQTNDIL